MYQYSAGGMDWPGRWKPYTEEYIGIVGVQGLQGDLHTPLATAGFLFLFGTGIACQGLSLIHI